MKHAQFYCDVSLVVFTVSLTMLGINRNYLIMNYMLCFLLDVALFSSLR